MTASPYEVFASQIVKADLPILLLDTCSILDIIRAPVRDRFHTRDIAAVYTLIGRAVKAPSTVSFVITKQVDREFRQNLKAVVDNTRSEISKASHEFSSILERMQALSSNTSIPNHVDLSSLGHPRIGQQLAQRVIQSSLILDDDNDDIVRAYHRVANAKPPATKAKQSVKDCHIIESYLRIADSLRSRGFSHNIVFITSNTKDYQQSHSHLHPELRSEFDSVRVEYAPNWSAARHELDRPSTE